MNDTTYCRLCLQKCSSPSIQLSENSKVFTTILDLFPGLDFTLVKDSEICNKCFKYVQFSHSLKIAIEKNEQDILSNLAEIKSIKQYTCRLCLNVQNIEPAILLFNKSCQSIPYTESRDMVEIAIINLDFMVLKKPVVCTACWEIVKSIYLFKKKCFATEKILKFYCIKYNISSLAGKELWDVCKSYHEHVSKKSGVGRNEQDSACNIICDKEQNNVSNSIDYFVEPRDVYSNNFTTDNEEDKDDIFEENAVIKTLDNSTSKILKVEEKNYIEHECLITFNAITKNTGKTDDSEKCDIENNAVKPNIKIVKEGIYASQTTKNISDYVHPMSIKSNLQKNTENALYKKKRNTANNSKKSEKRKEKKSEIILKTTKKYPINKYKETPWEKHCSLKESLNISKIYKYKTCDIQDYTKSINSRTNCQEPDAALSKATKNVLENTKTSNTEASYEFEHAESSCVSLETSEKPLDKKKIGRKTTSENVVLLQPINKKKNKQEKCFTKIWYCNICPYVSKYKHNVISHEARHNTNLDKHCRKKHNDKKFCKTLVQPINATADKNHLPMEISVTGKIESIKKSPLKCEECPYIANRSDQMEAHLKTHKSNEKIFKCPICSYITTKKDDLKCHIEENHSVYLKTYT